MKLNVKVIKTKKKHKPIVRQMLKEMSDCLVKMGDRPPMKIKANNRSYIVMIDGAIVGTFSLSKYVFGRCKSFYRFYIKEEYRGTGVAKLVMQKAEEICGKDLSGFILNVYNKNVGAIKLYEKMGYTTYHLEGIYIYMEKEINKKGDN
ncbi:MAG: GNAT family N-acetyltransferase [Cellulosilyticaceae bacterium]